MRKSRHSGPRLPRSFPNLPFAGSGDIGKSGIQFTTEDEPRILARITEQPSRSDDPDDDWPGYSWEQVAALPDGEFDVPEAGLIGDNGSTTGTVSNPAYDMGGDEEIAIDTIVELIRGYQHGGDDQDEPGQEWLILGGAGGSGGGTPANCSADCFDLIDPGTLALVFSTGDCTVTPTWYTKSWCGPACVNSTPCPSPPGCTACLKIYTSLVAKFYDATPCVVDLRELSPVAYLHGCFEWSTTPIPNSIPVISAYEPFQAIFDPDACTWTYSYGVVYVRGAFVDRSDPTTTIPFGTSNTVLPPVLVNTRNPSAVAANDAALDHALVAATALGGQIELPKGSIYKSTASGGWLLRSGLHSNLTISGQRDPTTLLTDFDPLPIGLQLSNSNLGTAALGYADTDTIGYLIHFTHVSGAVIEIGHTYGDAEAGALQVGDCLSLSMDNSTQVRVTDQQMPTIVSKADLGGGVWRITLSETVTLAGSAYKILRNSRKVDTLVGATITLVDHASAALFTPGKPALLTDGFAINDLYGEWFNVFDVNASAGTVTLDRVPEMTFVTGRMALVAGPFLTGVRVTDVSLGYTPSHGDVGTTLERVTNMIVALNMAASWKLHARDGTCAVELNSVQDAVFDNYDIYGLVYSEWARHVTVKNSRIRGHLYCNVGTEAPVLENCDILCDPTTSLGSAGFIQYVTGAKTDNGRITGGRLLTCYLGLFPVYGDRWVIDGLFIAAGLTLQLDGLGYDVRNCWGPGRVVLGTGSTGRLRNNACAVVGGESGWHEDLAVNVVAQQVISVLAAEAFYGTATQQLVDDLKDALLNLGIVKPFAPAYLPGTYSTAGAGDADFQATAGSFENAVGSTPAVADDDPVAFVTSTAPAVNPNNVYLDVPSSGLTSGQRPTLKLGVTPRGGDAWRFDGDDTLQFAGDTGFGDDGDEFGYFAVLNPSAYDGAILGSATSGRTWGLNSPGRQYLAQTGIAGVATSTSVVPTGQFSVAGVSYKPNGDGTATVRFYLNGVADGVAVVPAVAFGNPLSYLGSDWFGAFFVGDVADYWKGRAAPTEAQASALMAYWNEKHDLYPSGETPSVLSVAQGGTSADNAYDAFNNLAGSQVIFDRYDDVPSSHTDGTFDVLYSGTLGATALAADGDKVEADYTLAFAAHATATRQVRLKFAGTTVFDSGAAAYATGTTAVVTLRVIRESASVVRCQAAGTPPTGAALPPKYTRVTGLTLSGDNVLELSAAAAGAGAAAADVVANVGSARRYPAGAPSPPALPDESRGVWPTDVFPAGVFTPGVFV